MEANGVLIMDSSPLGRAGESTRKIMFTVCLTLVPALAVSVWMFGWDAVRVLALTAVFTVGVEALIAKFSNTKIDYLDGSALLTGILLAMNVPSNAPWWMLLIGAIVAVVIGKQVFGGLGQNIFNPALVARVFLLISFPMQMTSWPLPGAFDGTTGATPLGILKTEGIGAIKTIGVGDLAMGHIGGSLGEISALALLIGSLYLFYKKYITWEIPVVFIGTVFVFTGAFYLINPAQYASPVFHIFTGGLFLGALYMATDMVTSPLSFKGKLLFGFGCGFFTALIRLFGSYPEGVSFAILFMNAFVPLLDRYFPDKKFGMVKNG
ncbi:MAG: RnfABCDGE type electron transport complex subunit D [Calditrichaeota bacterium]|nr:RnfABCDGE type electron transport complex subunit D [Calditrichota bacterium]